jgi:hypothetical protein
MGFQDIVATESANASGVLAGQQPALGTIVTAVDDVYNGGEFIFLRGVAATVPGDVVTYSPGYSTTAGTTTRSVAATRGPLAVAVSSNVAGQLGWYQIQGAAVVNTTGVTANSIVYLTATAGVVSSTSTTAQKLDGAYALTATGTPAAGQSVIILNRPNAGGNS